MKSLSWPEDRGKWLWAIWKGRLRKVELVGLACTVRTKEGDTFCLAAGSLHEKSSDVGNQVSDGSLSSTDESVDGKG